MATQPPTSSVLPNAILRLEPRARATSSSPTPIERERTTKAITRLIRPI